MRDDLCIFICLQLNRDTFQSYELLVNTVLILREQAKKAASWRNITPEWPYSLERQDEAGLWWEGQIELD